LPGTAFIAALAWLLWRYFNLDGQGDQVHLYDMLLPFLLMLSVCVILHVFVAMVLPLRWQAIREEFQRQLAGPIPAEMTAAYGPIPLAVAEQLLAERRHVEQMLGETREVQDWLRQREQAASVGSLYGK